MSDGKRNILKALVGSRAHGLHDEQSDYDYRGVFVEPTREILRLGSKANRTSWIERDDAGAALVDDTAWEVGHFLAMAVKCNPSVLEVLASPDFEADKWGKELRDLLPALWNPKGVRDAFVGYGVNQRKKMLDDREPASRKAKYACAYLRTLVSAASLLESGVLLIRVSDHPMCETLRRFKRGGATSGEVIDTCDKWVAAVDAAALACQHKPDLVRVNDFLLRLRAEHW